MCPDRSILSAWFDGEVDLKWSNEISVHLESCDECRNYIQSIEDQKTLLQSAPLPDFEESLERVKSRIRGKRTVQGSIRFWERRIPLPAAAAAAVIAASVTFGTSLFTDNSNDRVLMTNLADGNFNSQSMNMPGDKIDEFFSMMESSLSDEFSSNSIVELPADVNLIFNGESQLVRSAGFNGSTSP
jgi:hypothetical protein